MQHFRIEGRTMRITLYGVVGFAMIWSGLVAADRRPLTAQAERGREIFLHSVKGAACANCHQMAEWERRSRRICR